MFKKFLYTFLRIAIFRDLIIGLATTFKEQIKMKYNYEPHLTLQGLYLIGLKKYA